MSRIRINGTMSSDIATSLRKILNIIFQTQCFIWNALLWLKLLGWPTRAHGISGMLLMDLYCICNLLSITAVIGLIVMAGSYSLFVFSKVSSGCCLLRLCSPFSLLIPWSGTLRKKQKKIQKVGDLHSTNFSNFALQDAS